MPIQDNGEQGEEEQEDVNFQGQQSPDEGDEESGDVSVNEQDESDEQNDPSEAGDLDVKLELSDEKKKDIVAYLEDNLPNMRMTQEEEDRIHAYLSMYDMASRIRNFPYEDAPSIPSSDAYEKMNEWLNKAEDAFLITNGTFSIDREEVPLEEDVIRRMEKTWHKKYFWGSGFAEELRLILFECGYLGGSILAVREEFDVEPRREKVILKNIKDLGEMQTKLTKSEYEKAKNKISKGEIYMGEMDVLNVTLAGAKIKRVKQTNFLYPQNEVDIEKWQICAEKEFYTKSDLMAMAEMGELDKKEVEKAVFKIRELAKAKDDDDDDDDLPEDVKPNILDSSYNSNMIGIKQFGDSYDEEFCTYRVTLKYKVPTEHDPTGVFRSWIEVIYCPAGSNILSSTFCKHGFPYFLVKFRPVPHKAIGSGIAQARYPFNVFDSDMKSLFMASLEQEIGSPQIIRKNSSLWSSGFRTYPGSVAYTEDPKGDIVPYTMPEKSRLSVEGMKIVLGSSPGANQGAGYASGQREKLLQQQRDIADKSRMHSIAVGLDAPMNMAWRIECQVSKLNNLKTKWIDWVYPAPPQNTKLYMLESEMNPEIIWTSILSAISETPDAMFAQALNNYQIFHEKIPVSVNSPRLSIAWLNYLAGFVSQFDDKKKALLLPNDQDFAQYQQQLGQMGGQNGQGGSPATPLTAQSQNTPFHRPAGPSGPPPSAPPPPPK